MSAEFKGFSAFNEHVWELIRSSCNRRRPSDSTRSTKVIQHALNGGGREALVKFTDEDARKSNGVYFTGELLASQLRQLADDVASNRDADFGARAGRDVVYDAACGAGDLLLQHARRLPVRPSLVETMRIWGSVLTGTDVSPTFVEATRLRLILLAIASGARAKSPLSRHDVQMWLPQIRRADGLKSGDYAKATTILLNPPFHRMQIEPRTYKWAKGSVTSAAAFVYEALHRSRPGTVVAAILPEVLRSGSRFQVWRQEVEKLLRIEVVRTHGIFDELTDIHVFSLAGVVRASPHLRPSSPKVSWWPKHAVEKMEADKIVADYFRISVGPVVPHRHVPSGPWAKYITARTAERWTDINEIHRSIRTTCRLHMPPFVVIRRTSRGGDSERAVASLVLGNRPVAVENHLIVCEPRDATIRSCRALMSVLKDTRTTEWLNVRIRCRHLTVSSVGEIPWHKVP